MYRPALLGVASLHYANARAKVDVWESLALVTDLREDDATRAPWAAARRARRGRAGTRRRAEAGARFAELPAAAADPKATRAGRRC